MTFTNLNSSLSGIAVAIAASTALLSTASSIVVTGAGRATPLADAVTCDMAQYRASPGFTVAMDQHVLTVAWTGQNGKSRELGAMIRLYKTTWENPSPDVQLASIDFISSGKTSAPFLIAITVE